MFWKGNCKGNGKRMAMTVVILTLLMAAVFTACTGQDKTSGSAKSVTPSQSGPQNKPGAQQVEAVKDEDLVIPVSDITEKATFYPIEIDGTQMEVIAVEAPDGTIRTAFNTCQICYDSGRGYYKQVGDKLVCQNCGNQFPMSQVEVESGGCNPWPIFSENKIVTDESITISYDYLKVSKEVFANWKSSY